DDAVVNTRGFFDIACKRFNKYTNIVAAAVKIYEPSTNRFRKGKTYYNQKDGKYPKKRIISYNGGGHFLRKEFYWNKLYPDKLMFGSEELYACLNAVKEGKVVAYFDDIQI